MLVCAVAVTPIFFAQWVGHLWIAVLIIGLATAAHQAWSANLFTLVSGMFPRKAVGSVIGIGGTAGALGGMLMAKRSEEHTSELQSLMRISYAVFCLKKKKKESSET